jgi:NAD(P)-dependent dehydrogenase (short-subunit alcohol dehydrogenase family)
MRRSSVSRPPGGFGRLGVRVNAIAPGEIDTAILSPGTEEIVAHQIPMHRLGTPDEVAKIVYVLCTDRQGGRDEHRDDREG